VSNLGALDDTEHSLHVLHTSIRLFPALTITIRVRIAFMERPSFRFQRIADGEGFSIEGFGGKLMIVAGAGIAIVAIVADGKSLLLPFTIIQLLVSYEPRITDNHRL
jgi:hypothetical protein